MAERLTADFLVVGGGLDGTGIARDAAGRGPRVVPCEQGDPAGATSSASSELIHGGLRHLECHGFRPVREAPVEREVPPGIAPRIARPMRFVSPRSRGRRPAWVVRLGLFLRDHLGGRKRPPGTRRLNPRRAAERAPIREGRRAAFECSDRRVDDARPVAPNAADARERGAPDHRPRPPTNEREASSMTRPLFAAVLLAASALAAPATAAEIRVACYSDGNECEVTQELAQRFMRSNPDVKVTIDRVPYKAIQESLPVQLAAGQGPDIARVADFGAISRHFLDLRPLLKDAAYWEANFGAVLPWMRATEADTGIYGLPTQLTVTGPIVNASLFEQAGVPLPGPKASWDEWVAAAEKVAKATGTQAGTAMDRSGHRFAAGAISHGARYFAADGTPAPVDEGFKAFAERVVRWNKTGAMEREVWAATGGASYRDAFEEFANGRVVVYYSGSWQVARLQSSIGDGFEWKIGPQPCGPAACTAMPGGASFVAFKATKAPQDVARFLDFLAGETVHAELMARTANIPAHAGLQKAALTYDQPPAAKAALEAFTKAGTEIAPLAYRLQGYIYNRPMFNATVARLSQAIVGELTLDQAYARIQDDVRSALAAAK